MSGKKMSLPLPTRSQIAVVRRLEPTVIPRSKDDDREDGNEIDLHDAIYRGNVLEVQTFFMANPGHGKNVDRNRQALAAMVPPIENNYSEILELLLKNGFRIGSFALFNAVRAGSKDCVKIILQNIDDNEGSKDVGPETIMKGYFINPLIVSIQLKQYDIIGLFVEKGYRIKTSKDHVADEEKHEERKQCVFEPSLRDIHYYRAVSDPVYIANTYLNDDEANHPLSQIFSLNKELLQKGAIDFEFKNNYQDLSKRLEEFAVDLMEECHKDDEIKALTDVDIDKDDLGKTKKYIEVKSDGDAKQLSFLNLAIRRENVATGLSLRG